MKQQSLFRNQGRHGQVSLQAQMNKHDRANREAAEIIFDDVERNGGEGSISVVWARQVLGKDAQRAFQEAA